MTKRGVLRFLLPIVAAVLAVTLVAANAGSDDDASAGPPDGSPPATTDDEGGPSIDWDRVTSPVDLGDGWVLVDAEGDGPFVAVERDGRYVGAIEIARYPLGSFPALADEVAAGDESAILDAFVRQFIDSLTEDRAAGCGEEYRVDPHPVRAVETVDVSAVRYGFTGQLADGSPSELIIQWAGVRGDTLVTIVAAAYDDGGCLPPEGPGLQTSDLTAIEGPLGRLVERSPFPAASE